MPITVIETVRYGTSDGRIFDNRDEARRHEDALEFVDLVEGDGHFVCGQMDNLREFLLRNAPAIVAWLNKQRLPPLPPFPPEASS